MLLGQTVNAYQHEGVDFAELLARVHEVPELKRLRFTTSHPEHVTPRLADALRDLPRVCPYVHLPVQSGSDRILGSMRRGYTRGQYLETIALLRDRVRDLALSSDVIVGYPGETEEDFQSTVDLVDEAVFEGLFVFAYSPRPGTTAHRLEDDVPEGEKRRRVALLNSRQQRWQRRLNRERIGSRDEVLVDTVTGSAGWPAGRATSASSTSPAPRPAGPYGRRGDRRCRRQLADRTAPNRFIDGAFPGSYIVGSAGGAVACRSR